MNESKKSFTAFGSADDGTVASGLARKNSRRIGARLAFGLGCLTILMGALDASANNQAGITTVHRPGDACRSLSTNVGTWFSSFQNWGSTVQTAWCPLDSFAAPTPNGQNSGETYQVSVDVNPGWANTNSCVLVGGLPTFNHYFVLPTNAVAHSNGIDIVEFTPGFVDDTEGLQVNCQLPQFGQILDYKFRTFVDFDWSTW